MIDYYKLYCMKKEAYERKYAGDTRAYPFPQFRFWLLTVKEDMKADAAEERYNNAL